MGPESEISGSLMNLKHEKIGSILGFAECFFSLYYYFIVCIDFVFVLICVVSSSANIPVPLKNLTHYKGPSESGDETKENLKF